MGNNDLLIFYAYIGPGLGAGVVALVLGIITSIFLAILAITWYPLKRLINRIKKKKAEKTSSVPAKGDGQ